MEQQSNYIGIDLSKAGIDVAVRPESIAWQRIASTKTLPKTSGSLNKMFSKIGAEMAWREGSPGWRT